MNRKMKHAINKIYHTAGAGIMVFGILMLIKAGGMADLGGDFTEMVHVCWCSAAAITCGAFLRRWNV